MNLFAFSQNIGAVNKAKATNQFGYLGHTRLISVPFGIVLPSLSLEDLAFPLTLQNVRVFV